MSRLHPKDMNIGDIFCEHDSFLGTITAKVTQQPYTTGDGFEGRKQWHWKADNVETGEPIKYLLTEGLEHYGPRLYHPSSVLLPRPMKRLDT